MRVPLRLFCCFSSFDQGPDCGPPFLMIFGVILASFWHLKHTIFGSIFGLPKKTAPRWPRIALGAVRRPHRPASSPRPARTGIFRRPGPPGKPTIKEEQLKNTPPKMRTGLTRPGPQARRIFEIRGHSCRGNKACVLFHV